MKLTFIISVFFLAINFLACSKSNKNITIDKASNTPDKKSLSIPIDAQSLMKTSDCYACHKVKDKFLGPSWHEIAKEYSVKDVDYLVARIIEGGTGNWGELYMTPHHKISIEEAKIMAEYIVTITNN